MIASNYSPRPGSKAALALQLLAEEGPQSRARIASHVDTAQHNVEGILGSAVKAGFVVKMKEGGSVRWALAEGVEYRGEQPTDEVNPVEIESVPEPEPDAEQQAGFACSIWSDGELQIVVNGESLTLSAQNTSELLAYLKPFVSELEQA